MSAEIITPSNQIQPIEIGFKKGDDVQSVIKRNRESLDNLDALLDGNPACCLTAGYGTCRRSTHPRQPASPSSDSSFRADSVATLFSTEQISSPFESWAFETGAGSRKRSALLQESFSQLLPGVRFDGIDRRNRRLLFETPDGVYPLHQLGDGTRSLVAWLGDLLFRISSALPDLATPFSATGLLLIDDLDLHLHPVWQREIVGFLRDRLPNFQIVATTNSALTAHQAGPGELWFLQRDRPDLPPAIHRYEGDPSRLMLHQLLASPLFGIDTVDSKPVERLRAEQKSLAGRPAKSLSAAERSRRRALEQQIRDLPGWNSMLPGEQEKRKLLESIERALTADPAASEGTAGKRKRK